MHGTMRKRILTFVKDQQVIITQAFILFINSDKEKFA